MNNYDYNCNAEKNLTIRNSGYVPQPKKSVQENYDNIYWVKEAFFDSINQIWNEVQYAMNWQNWIDNNIYYDYATQSYYYGPCIVQQQNECYKYKMKTSMYSAGFINQVFQTISDSVRCINEIYRLSSATNNGAYSDELDKFCRLHSNNIPFEAEQILKSLRYERNQAIHNLNYDRLMQYIFNNNTVYIISNFIEIIFNDFNNIMRWSA